MKVSGSQRVCWIQSTRKNDLERYEEVVVKEGMPEMETVEGPSDGSQYVED